jgi:RNA polymerase sigma-70 factor (ECF subfamily)
MTRAELDREFPTHLKALRAYLYRLTAHREEAEDIAQETYLRASRSIERFRGDSRIRTWLFAIATNIARDALRRRARWEAGAQDRARELAESDPLYPALLRDVHGSSPQGLFEIKEHVDFCFTCIAKTLPIEEQVCLLLKDVYGFRVREIVGVVGLPDSTVKHRLRSSRQKMIEIFEGRCALVSKRGVCHQCSELNGFFNPRQKQAEQELQMVRERDGAQARRLYELRRRLVRSIDPLDAAGTDLHDTFMRLTRVAVGEEEAGDRLGGG